MEYLKENMFRFRTLIVLLAVTFGLSACGIFGSDDDGNPLEGDLSYEVEGEPGESPHLFFYTSSGPMQEHGETIGTITIGSSGVASGDLENGDYRGVRVAAMGLGPERSITLRLLSNGNVLDETSQRETSGPFEGQYIVEYGEFPDWSDFQGQ